MVKKKSISAIISVILLILVTTVLVAGFLSWSKTTARERLDLSKDELQSASKFECMRYSLVVESCSIDETTNEVSLLLRNQTPIDFRGLSLTLQGKSLTSENILKLYGKFDSPIRAGEIKNLKTSSGFTIINNDLNIDTDEIIDIDYLDSFTLSTETCPQKTINLKSCANKQTSFEAFFSGISNLDKKRINIPIAFNTTLTNAKGTPTCEFYQTKSGSSQVRMNPSNKNCNISYTFTVPGLYEILLVATDEDVVSSKTIILDLREPLLVTILSPTNEKSFNINKTFNLTSQVTNNFSDVLCNWSHKRSDLSTYTSFSTSCNTSLSLSIARNYSIKLDVTDSEDLSTSSDSISVNILGNFAATISNLPRNMYNNNEAINFSGSYNNNTSAVTCEWISKINDVNTFRSNNCSSFSYTFTTTGSYTVYYKVTNSENGEVATSSVSFSVVTPLTGTITSPTNGSVYNLSQSINFSVGSINNMGTLSYTWQYNRDGTGWVNFGSNSSSFSTSFATAGVYQFRVLLTDAGRPVAIYSGYSNTITNISVSNPLSVSITSPASGTSYNVNSSNYYYSTVYNAIGNVSYTWQYSTNQSNWTTISGNASYGIISFSGTGTYYIRVVAVDSASRTATSSSTFYVNIINPVTPDLTNIVLSGQPSYFSFYPSNYTYNGVIYLSSSVSSISVTPTGSGTITVNGAIVSSGSASSGISINDGAEKTITVVATVSGANPKTYTIKVRKLISTGGTITEGVTNGYAWRVHKFVSSGTFNANMAFTGKLLVVGGGGGGCLYGGKGGNGGTYNYYSSQAISSGNTTVTIGNGGYRGGWPRVSTNGTNSLFGSVVSTGGTTFDADNWNFGDGGANGQGVLGALYTSGGTGAPGIANNIVNLTNVYYAKGGDGGEKNTPGLSNTGNGGSGSSADSPVYGGTGIVVVRIELPV